MRNISPSFCKRADGKLTIHYKQGTYMKQFFAKVNKFVMDRAHLYHFLGGVGIFFAVYLSSALGNSQMWAAGFSATVATFATMFSLEVKDKQYGNKVDWEDILAGMIFPIIFWIAMAVSCIVSLF